MKQAVKFIREHASFVVTTHANPEGDAVGSVLAMADILERMGKKAYAYMADPVPRNLLFLPGADRVIKSADELPQAQAAVVLDCGDLDRPGNEFPKMAKGLPLLNIDHHKTNSRFGAVNLVDPDASSTGEILVGLFKEAEVEISPRAALCLFTAILTDTGSFQHPNTGEATLRAAADMIAAGARPETAARNYYHAKPAAHLMLMAKAMATLRFNRNQTVAAVTVTKEMYKKTGAGPEAVEGLINVLTDAETVKIAVLFRQTGEAEWKVSLRSKGEADVAALAQGFGGGGHQNAAGCTIKGSLEEVEEKIFAKTDQLAG